MELVCIHRSPDDRRGHHHPATDPAHAASGGGDLSVIDSAIVSISLFVGGLHLLDYNWRDMIRSPASQRVYTELEQEELALYGELLSTDDGHGSQTSSSSVPTTASSATAAAVDAGVNLLSLSEPPTTAPHPSSPPLPLPLPKIDGPANAIVYAIITEKNGTLSIFRLDDMRCIVRTPLVSLQTDHVPLSLWNPHVPPTTPGGAGNSHRTAAATTAREGFALALEPLRAGRPERLPRGAAGAASPVWPSAPLSGSSFSAATAETWASIAAACSSSSFSSAWVSSGVGTAGSSGSGSTCHRVWQLAQRTLRPSGPSLAPSSS